MESRGRVGYTTVPVVLLLRLLASLRYWPTSTHRQPSLNWSMSL